MIEKNHKSEKVASAIANQVEEDSFQFVVLGTNGRKSEKDSQSEETSKIGSNARAIIENQNITVCLVSSPDSQPDPQRAD